MSSTSTFTLHTADDNTHRKTVSHAHLVSPARAHVCLCVQSVCKSTTRSYVQRIGQPKINATAHNTPPSHLYPFYLHAVRLLVCSSSRLTNDSVILSEPLLLPPPIILSYTKYNNRQPTIPSIIYVYILRLPYFVINFSFVNFQTSTGAHTRVDGWGSKGQIFEKHYLRAF